LPGSGSFETHLSSRLALLVGATTASVARASIPSNLSLSRIRMYLESLRRALLPPLQPILEDTLKYDHHSARVMTTTDFHMPLPAGQYPTSPTQYTIYGTQAQPISPLSSATATPHTSSPNSPRSVISAIPPHTRQLRPPKSPLYVPAVLRPTEPPKRVVKPSPMSPGSPQGSFDSMLNTKPLSRQSTADSGKWGLVGGEVNAEGFGPVTDPPSRDHWKPDHEAAVCDETTCTRSFSYFTRRHHCRRCGNIFCDLHSAYVIPLDQDANYHPKGYRSRACAFCYSEYKGWEISRSSRSNSESSTDLQDPGTPTTPSMNCTSKRLSNMFGPKPHSMPESLAQSVPRDWSWSTF